MSDRETPSRRALDSGVSVVAAANARTRSESATLVSAVAAAVTLGIACGIWINSRLTPRPTAGAPQATYTSARPLPDARASAPLAPAAQPSPCDGCETSSSDEATPARVPADKADEARPKTDAGTPADASRTTAPGDARDTPGRADEAAAESAGPHGSTKTEAAATTGPDPSRPVAWEVGPLPKAGARAAARGNVRQGAAQEREKERGAQAQSEPCSLYASAASLRLQAGGVAPLVLGGPGAGVRINVSTPDWAELAVIYEGPAAGHNGWLRYSVRSVGRRPGLYTVRVSSPCGSQTIPVTVKGSGQ